MTSPTARSRSVTIRRASGSVPRSRPSRSTTNNWSVCAGSSSRRPQVARRRFQRHVLAHGDLLEIHQRADRAFLVGQRRAQLLALFLRQRADHVLHHLLGQVGREVGDLVGFQRAGRGDQFLRIHGRDERLAHRVRHFEQDLALALGLDQVPDHQPLVERQRLEDVGDVGRVQLLELGAQLGEMLLVHQLLHQLMARHRLPPDQALDQLVPAQQLLDLAQVLLQVLDFERGSAISRHAFRESALRACARG